MKSVQEMYKSGRDFAKASEGMDELINFLRAHTDSPTPAKALGVEIFGERYNACDRWGDRDRSLINHLGQMLRHLRSYGMIKQVKIDGDPVEVTNTKFVRDYPDYKEPPYIKAYDSTGNYLGEILNPKYDCNRASRGRWAKVTETITPKINAWVWIGD